MKHAQTAWEEAGIWNPQPRMMSWTCCVALGWPLYLSEPMKRGWYNSLHVTTWMERGLFRLQNFKR